MPASINAEASMICARQSRALVAEQAFHLAQRLAALPIGVGVNQIVERFGFGEIELAVLKRAAGEFAGLGGPHIFKSRQCGKQCRQHRAAAMDVKLRDVLAGGAGRSRKPQHHRIVDRPLADIMQQHPRHHPWSGKLARQRSKAVPACGPDTRTKAIALGRRPDDSAKMVCSRGCIAYLSPGR